MTNIFPMLLPESHKERLAEFSILYFDVFDMVEVFYTALSNNEMRLIKEGELGIAPDELRKMAEKNLNETTVISSISSVLGIEESDKDLMYVITNHMSFLGAAAAFSSKALDALRKKFGDVFYLIPSSIHEMLAVSDTTETDMLRVNKEVNMVAVAESDFLANNVYKYDHGRITPVKGSGIMIVDSNIAA